MIAHAVPRLPPHGGGGQGAGDAHPRHPVLVYGSDSALGTLGVLGAVWVVTTATSVCLDTGAHDRPLLESAAVGVVAAVSLGSGATLLAALAVPPFAAGLRQGVRGVALSFSVEASCSSW